MDRLPEEEKNYRFRLMFDYVPETADSFVRDILEKDQSERRRAEEEEEEGEETGPDSMDISEKLFEMPN